MLIPSIILEENEREKSHTVLDPVSMKDEQAE
jgi:hypothetical protein